MGPWVAASEAKSPTPTQEPPADELEATLREAVDAGQWVVFGGHGIRERDLVDWEIDAALIRRIVAFGRAHGVWIDTIEKVGSSLQPFL